MAAARSPVPRDDYARDLPLDLLEGGFRVEGQRWVVRDEVRSDVELVEQDLRAEQPAGPFDLVLCRNLAFTYFDHLWQLRIAKAIGDRLGIGGVLVIGKHERLPEEFDGLSPLRAHDGIFEKR